MRPQVAARDNDHRTTSTTTTTSQQVCEFSCLSFAANDDGTRAISRQTLHCPLEWSRAYRCPQYDRARALVCVCWSTCKKLKVPPKLHALAHLEVLRAGVRSILRGSMACLSDADRPFAAPISTPGCVRRPTLLAWPENCPKMLRCNIGFL